MAVEEHYILGHSPISISCSPDYSVSLVVWYKKGVIQISWILLWRKKAVFFEDAKMPEKFLDVMKCW